MAADNQTILVVEDEEADAMLIEQAFRDNGVTCAVRRVKDGAEAIEYLMGEGRYADREKFGFPSFVLTDLNMPKVGGFELLEQLKRNPEWARIPAVVLSASKEPDDVRRSYVLGARSFHQKPNGYESLREELRDVYGSWMKPLR